MKRGKTYDWIPLWVDKWIFGSTRIELEHDERAIWIDLMALASKDDGYIRANEKTPYQDQQLAGILCCDLELLIRTKEKCVKYGKIRIDKKGIIYLINWEGYRLTPRHKRRFEITEKEEKDRKNGHDVRKNGHDVRKSGPYTETNTETDTETNTERRSIYNLLVEVKGIGEEKAKTLTNFIVDELIPEFPEVDAVEQVKKKCAWWRDNPITKKSRLHSQMRNWFKKAQEFLDEAEKEKQVGRSKKTEPKKDWQKNLDRLMDKAEKEILKKFPDLKGEELEQKIKKARAEASQKFWKNR